MKAKDVKRANKRFHELVSQLEAISVELDTMSDVGGKHDVAAVGAVLENLADWFWFNHLKAATKASERQVKKLLKRAEHDAPGIDAPVNGDPTADDPSVDGDGHPVDPSGRLKGTAVRGGDVIAGAAAARRP